MNVWERSAVAREEPSNASDQNVCALIVLVSFSMFHDILYVMVGKSRTHWLVEFRCGDIVTAT